MYSYYANNLIIKTLTDEQLEAAYRVRQMQYRIEDIKAHAEDMFDHGDLTAAEYAFVCDFAQELAERYIYKYHDCNLAENDVMESMIRDYCQDHAQEIAVWGSKICFDEQSVKSCAKILYEHDRLQEYEYEFVCATAPALIEEFCDKFPTCSFVENKILVRMIGLFSAMHMNDYMDVFFSVDKRDRVSLYNQIVSAKKRSINGTPQTASAKETVR